MAFIIVTSRREGVHLSYGHRGQDWHTTGSEKGTTMKKLLIIGIAAGLLCTAAYAAYPSLAGMSGNGVLPTASVQAPGVWNAAVDYYNTTDDATTLFRGLYGAGPVEIGATYTLAKTMGDDANSWGVNAKYGLPFAPAGFKTAVGASYVSTDFTGMTGKTTQIYLVGTRPVALGEEEGAMAIDVTLGLNWTKMDDTGMDGDGVRGILAAGTTLANKLSLAAEFQTKNDDMDADALYDFVARYPFTDAISGQVGYTNLDPWTRASGMDDGNIYAGVNFTFGGAAAEE